MELVTKKNTDEVLRRSPPQDLEAEQCVLGAVLLDNAAYARAARIIEREDFYRDSHRALWDAMSALVQAGEGIDAFTLKDTLRGVGALEGIGGPAYIAELATVVPTASNIAYYARRVRITSLLRQGASKATQVASRCFEPSPDPEFGVELIQELSWEFSQLALKSRHRDERTKQESLTAAAIAFNQRKGVALGFPELDKVFCGMEPNELTVVAARTSQGKTAFASNIAFNLASAGSGICYFTLEMTEEQMWTRFLSLVAGVDSFRSSMEGFREGDEQRVEDARQRLNDLPIQIAYRNRKHPLRPHDIRLRCERLSNEMQLKGIVVDYLGLMRGDRREKDHWFEKGEIVTSLKEIADDFGIFVMLMVQVNREGDDNKPPRLSQLRDTGVAEEHAGNVLMLWKPPAEKKQFSTKYTGDMVQLIIAKQRNGPAPTALDMLFDRSIGAFKEVEPQ